MTLKHTVIFILLSGLGTIRSALPEEPMEHSVIAIEYIGETDKPVTPIVISDSKVGAEWYRDSVLKRGSLELTEIHVIKSSLLQALIADVDVFKRTVPDKGERNIRRSKTMSIAVIADKRKDTFLYDAGEASLLLRHLQKSCGHGSLRSSLAHFEDRTRALRRGLSD